MSEAAVQAGLAGRRIVLIGASAGIGLETARRAGAAGAEVVVASRSADRLDAATENLPGIAARHVVDATDEQALATMFAEVGQFDHLAVFVPAARDPSVSAKFGRFLAMDAETVEAIFRQRFWAHLYAIRQGAPRMRPGGAIVLVSNTQPRKTIPGYAVSAAAAGALEALARALAVELSPVRVNVVAPGFIASKGTDEIPAERRARWRELTAAQPVKRLGETGEVAAAILFLMASDYTTGALLSVDGGYSLS